MTPSIFCPAAVAYLLQVELLLPFILVFVVTLMIRNTVEPCVKEMKWIILASSVFCICKCLVYCFFVCIALGGVLWLPVCLLVLSLFSTVPHSLYYMVLSSIYSSSKFFCKLLDFCSMPLTVSVLLDFLNHQTKGRLFVFLSTSNEFGSKTTQHASVDLVL